MSEMGGMAKRVAFRSDGVVAIPQRAVQDGVEPRRREGRGNPGEAIFAFFAVKQNGAEPFAIFPLCKLPSVGFNGRRSSDL
jgi:hypothetical protein